MKRKHERRERAQLIKDLQKESERSHGYRDLPYIRSLADRVLKEKREARKAAA